jgi:mannobiose 2-epimerase
MSLSAHDINADKTMNSHLHLLEAYANLYRVWPDPSLKAAGERLLGLVCETVMAPSGHLQLYFRRDWTVLPGGVSFGHDIETSWLVRECAFFLGGEALEEKVRPAALLMGAAGNEGILPDGSMRYERLADGTDDLSRQWWVQAETVVGNLHLWKGLGDPAGLPRAAAAWAFIRDRLIDRDGGEWYWGLFADGTPDTANPKAGFWKCPYHNARMCLQAMEILKDQ